MKIIENNQFNKESKIAIVTLYDSNYEEFAKYSIPNKLMYANKHKYDLIYFDDVLDSSRPPQWSKIKAIESVLNKYDWVWWIDIDSMVMNFDITLESIIDDNFDLIFTKNDHSYISNGSSFFKNTPLTKQFLKEAYELQLDYLKNIDVNVFDHEQQSMRALLHNEDKYKTKTKLINERVCNSFCKTNNQNVLNLYPNWNNEENIYQEGDFIIQFCGRTFDERLNDMFNYILPKKISLVLLSHDQGVIKNQLEIAKKSNYELDVLSPRENNEEFFSFSQLINNSVNETECEFMVFVNPKTQFQVEDIDFIIKQLHAGYCYVSVVGFGLFGATKQLFREIGLMDERFFGGEYEDNDMAIRLKLFNKAIYVKLDYSKYIHQQSPSKYNSIRGCALTMFYDKWNFIDNKVLIDKKSFQSTKKISKRHKKENNIKYSWLDYDKSFIDNNYHVFQMAKNNEIYIIENQEKKIKNNDINVNIKYNYSDKNYFITFNSKELNDIISCHIVNITNPTIHHCQYEHVLKTNMWWKVTIDAKDLFELRIFYRGNLLYRNILNKDLDLNLEFCLPIKVL